jgi:signal transduction histidine kinase
MTQQSGDSPVEELIGKMIVEHRGQILDAYDELLVQARGPLILPTSSQEIRGQAVEILDNIRERLLATDGSIPSRTGPYPRQESPPSESLRAVGALCQAVLTTVAERLPGRTPTTEALVRLAIVLQQTITDRMAFGTTSYIGYLLERLHRSHADERRRVARELHDLVAHSVAVALQNLELYAVHRESDPRHADRKLEIALATLRETVDMVRALAHDLRRSGAEEGLRVALQAYIATLVADDVTFETRFAGDERRIPPPIRGELFLILREALRNARTHSGGRHIRVEIVITHQLIRAIVMDDGRGFDPQDTVGATGLTSMRERAALLGGDVKVSSVHDQGTSVHVEVPLRTYDEHPS